MDENCSEGSVSNPEVGGGSTDIKPRIEVGKSSPNERAESPDSNCAICLGKLQNKSFTDSCLHQFCFTCLVEWSKVKPECPLCKQCFKSIIHNVRSIEDYDQYDILRPAVEPPTVNIRNFRLLVDRPAFRYRTTMLPVFGILQRFETLIPPMYNHRSNRHLSRHHASGQGFHHPSRAGTSHDRQLVYLQSVWVRRLPDVTGRYRKCSPRFLANNPAQMHRLVPWLNRELNALLVLQGGSEQDSEELITIILGLVVRYAIRSTEFRNNIVSFLRGYTDHFIHEFHSFAISPYDMIGYDRHATYGPAPSLSDEAEDPDDSSSSDSDVQIVDVVRLYPNASSRTPSPEAGPSGFAANRHQTATAASASITSNSVSSAPCIAISSEAESDGEDEDCVIVGSVKPRHLRTPEIITISDDGMDDSNDPDVSQNVSDEVDNSEQASSAEDIKPSIDAIDCRTSDNSSSTKSSTTSKLTRTKESTQHRSNEMPSKSSRFRPIYNKYTSSDSELSASDSSSTSEEWNSRKRKRVKAKRGHSNSKKKSKESRKNEVVSKSKKKKHAKHWKKKFYNASDSSSSEDESVKRKKRAKRARALSSSSSAHDSECHSPKAESNSSTNPRLRSVVHVRRNTQESSHSSSTSRSYDPADASHSPAASSSSALHHAHARQFDGHSAKPSSSSPSSSRSRSSSISSRSPSSSLLNNSDPAWVRLVQKYRIMQNYM